jgi:hypothetical protein
MLHSQIMDEVEAMAVREPLLAKTLMLDTVQKDDQKREEFLDQLVTSTSIPFLVRTLETISYLTEDIKLYNQTAMDEVEAMAVREPLLAKTLMLDTVQKDDQRGEEWPWMDCLT